MLNNNGTRWGVIEPPPPHTLYTTRLPRICADRDTDQIRNLAIALRSPPGENLN